MITAQLLKADPMLNRRAWLGVMGSACLLPRTLAAHETRRTDVCLSAEPGLFPGDDVVSQMQAARAAGFVGFCDGELLLRSHQEQQAIVQAAANLGLRLGPVRRPVMPGLPGNQATWSASLLPLLEPIARHNLPGLRLSIGPQWTRGMTELSQQRMAFRQLANAVQAYGLTLFLEPWDDGRGGSRHFALCHQFVKTFDHPALKLSVDTQHWSSATAHLWSLLKTDTQLVGHLELGVCLRDEFGRTPPSAEDWYTGLRDSGYQGQMAIRHGLDQTGVAGIADLQYQYRRVMSSTWA